jgi:hypothetical protein
VKLLRPEDVSLGHGDKVFRQSPVTGVLAAVCFLLAGGAAAAAGRAGILPGFAAVLSSGTLLIFALVASVIAWRGFGSQNWLLATDGHRLLIRLRSYLNPEFPTDLSCILELRPEDVSGFRAAESRRTGHDAAGEPANETTMFLDIVLDPATDLSSLADQLSAERRLRSRGAAWRHYPVTIVNDRTLRLEWRGKHARVKPPVDEAIRSLAMFAGPLPLQRERVDLGTMAGAPVNEQPERAVRALAEQGRINEATLLAVRSFGFSATEARQYVERIASTPALPPPEPDA